MKSIALAVIITFLATPVLSEIIKVASFEGQFPCYLTHNSKTYWARQFCIYFDYDQVRKQVPSFRSHLPYFTESQGETFDDNASRQYYQHWLESCLMYICMAAQATEIKAGRSITEKERLTLKKQSPNYQVFSFWDARSAREHHIEHYWDNRDWIIDVTPLLISMLRGYDLAGEEFLWLSEQVELNPDRCNSMWMMFPSLEDCGARSPESTVIRYQAINLPLGGRTFMVIPNWNRRFYGLYDYTWR